MQVQTDAWTVLLSTSAQLHASSAAARQADAAQFQENTHGGGSSRGWLGLGWAMRVWGSSGSSGAVRGREQGDLEAPLLGGEPLPPLPQQQQRQQRQQQQQQQQQMQGGVHGVGSRGEGSVGDALLDSLFAPLEFQAQPKWGWLDVARYLSIKHSIDMLLVRC